MRFRGRPLRQGLPGLGPSGTWEAGRWAKWGWDRGEGKLTEATVVMIRVYKGHYGPERCRVAVFSPKSASESNTLNCRSVSHGGRMAIWRRDCVFLVDGSNLASVKQGTTRDPRVSL